MQPKIPSGADHEAKDGPARDPRVKTDRHDLLEVSTMIRAFLNNHRPWSQALFILGICAGLGLSADRVAADPLDLEELVKRGQLRVSGTLAGLKATTIQQPIIIGPFPEFMPRNRLPHRWSPIQATPRGPRTKQRPTHHFTLDAPSERSKR